MAVPFEKVLDNIIEDRRLRIKQLEKNKEELLDIWNKLPKVGEIKVKKQGFQVLESKRQINLKLNDFVKNCKQSFRILLKDEDLAWIYNTSFFEALGDKKKKDKLNVKIITNYDSFLNYISEELGIFNSDLVIIENGEVPSFFLSDNREILLILDNNRDLSGIWTDYSTITNSYSMLFNLLWKK
jgi:sugar-specific transcriptional regulator TrmB